jgi:hypothetical protein
MTFGLQRTPDMDDIACMAAPCDWYGDITKVEALLQHWQGFELSEKTCVIIEPSEVMGNMNY